MQNLVYLPELLGLPAVPGELQPYLESQGYNVSEITVQPPYTREELDELSPEDLTWVAQARRAKLWLEQTFDQPPGLLGNSLGVMQAVNLLHEGYQPRELWLYKIPTFGETRAIWPKKYRAWAEDVPDLLNRIGRSSEEKAGYLSGLGDSNIAKWLEGAALSDIAPQKFEVISKFSTRVIPWNWDDDTQHPRSSLDHLMRVVVEANGLIPHILDLI